MLDLNCLAQTFLSNDPLWTGAGMFARPSRRRVWEKNSNNNKVNNKHVLGVVHFATENCRIFPFQWVTS